jgi:hypothetical protein
VRHGDRVAPHRLEACPRAERYRMSGLA